MKGARAPVGPPGRHPGVLLLAALLACAALATAGLGGCGGDDERVSLRVGVVPIADVAPLYLGVERGFFEREGLSVELREFAGGAAITPAVLGGELEFGFSNTVSLLIAASQGLPVLIVAQGVLGGTDEDDAWAQLLVRGDGPIRTVRDLEGATIAVNTLNNICEVAIKASLEKEGASVAALNFVEMPIPAMRGALARGEADGACSVEPYVTHAEAAGARGILPFYVRTAPDLTVATYFTSRGHAREQPDVVDRFVRAVDASLAYAQAHPREVRRVLTTYAEVPPGTAERITLPTWRADLNRPTIGLLARLAEKYGLIEAQPDLDALIRAPA